MLRLLTIGLLFGLVLSAAWSLTAPADAKDVPVAPASPEVASAEPSPDSPRAALTVDGHARLVLLRSSGSTPERLRSPC